MKKYIIPFFFHVKTVGFGSGAQGWLRELGLSRLQKRRLRETFITLYNSMREGFGEAGSVFSPRYQGTGQNSLKLHQVRFRLGK